LEDIRWQRIVLNDTENIPMSMAIAWGTAFIGKSPEFHAALVLAFALAR
jgi:hypothetical protein